MKSASDWIITLEFEVEGLQKVDVEAIQADARKDLEAQLKEAVDLLEAWEQDTYPATLRAWVRWREMFLAKIKEGK